MEFKLNTIEEAIEEFKKGNFVIVIDDEDRENEGDFIMAAEKITPEHVNFMLKNGRGVLCAPVTEDRCKELNLDMQVHDNTSLLGTPFTVTVDLLGNGCTTGVSMHDRAMTKEKRKTLRNQGDNRLYLKYQASYGRRSRYDRSKGTGNRS